MVKKIILNNLIKVSIKNKRKHFKIQLCKSDLKYLNFFINLNLIKFIKKDDKNYFLVYLNLNGFNITLKNMYKPSRKLIIKSKELLKLSLKKKKNFLVSTSNGLLYSSDKKCLRLGGIILASLQI